MEKNRLLKSRTTFKRLISFVFMFTVFHMCSFTYAFADTVENKKLSVKFKNSSMLEVLDYLDKNTNCDFLYNNDDIKQIPSITYEFKNATILQILTKCLHATKYVFSVRDNLFVINKIEEKSKKFLEIKGIVL